MFDDIWNAAYRLDSISILSNAFANTNLPGSPLCTPVSMLLSQCGQRIQCGVEGGALQARRGAIRYWLPTGLHHRQALFFSRVLEHLKCLVLT